MLNPLVTSLVSLPIGKRFCRIDSGNRFRNHFKNHFRNQFRNRFKNHFRNRFGNRVRFAFLKFRRKNQYRRAFDKRNFFNFVIVPRFKLINYKSSRHSHTASKVQLHPAYSIFHHLIISSCEHPISHLLNQNYKSSPNRQIIRLKFSKIITSSPKETSETLFQQ